MKNNKNAVLMAMALLSLPVSAQVKIDSIAPHRYAAQSIDVGANVNFSREQSTSAVSVRRNFNKRSAKNHRQLYPGTGFRPVRCCRWQYAGINPNLLHPRHAESRMAIPHFSW